MSKKTTTTAEKKADESVKNAEHSQVPVNARLSKDDKVELYRKMLVARSIRFPCSIVRTPAAT